MSNHRTKAEPGIAPRRVAKRRVLAQAAVLFVVWLILSGHYDWFHLALGIISVSLVMLINRQILPLTHHETAGYHPLRFGRALFYIPWLAWEMILSGTHVAYAVLHPKMPISPCFVRFKSRQPNEFAKVILGNSITLTPGTLTLDIEGDEFQVHALTEGTAASLVDGAMQTKVARLFIRQPEQMVYDVRMHPSRKST